MPEFYLVGHAPRSPTQCVFCGDFGGPFVETYTELVGYGNVYVCAPNENRPGCLGQMARLAGLEAPQDRSQDEENLVKLEGRIKELEETVQALEAIREVQIFLNKREKRTYTRKPVEKPVKEPA